MPNLLITCMGSPTSESVITAIQKNCSANLFITDRDASMCPYVKGVRVIESAPSGSDKAFIEYIVQASNKYALDFVLAYADEELLALATNEETTSLCFVSPPEAIEQCLDKCCFTSILLDLGVPTPKFKSCGPVFCRPRFGRGSRASFPIKNDDLIRVMRKSDDFILTELVENGSEFSVVLSIAT